jgi:tryptophanase
MNLSKLIEQFPPDEGLCNQPRPYFNHSIEMKSVFTAAERAEMLESVGLNVFYFPSEMITGCDLLSDSGTTAMTNEQWAALHLGDESYGSNKGYFMLADQIREMFGEDFFNSPNSGRPNAFIFHQGRPCEDALFTILSREGSNMVIPSNGHFDTTQANIEANNIQALNLFSPELKDDASDFHFKGNINIPRLKKLLEDDRDRVPMVFITITNNTGGGQPVSLANIAEASEIAHSHDIPIFFDACRFAENAWFIKQYEKGYENRYIWDIVREMFSYVDGFTISFKKDGLSNMGGGLFLRDDGLFVSRYPQIPDTLFNYQIIKEGHPTYGGLAGREIMALVIGLRTVTQEKYLTHRINQVQRFGQAMVEHGIPILTPAGGHALYLDVNRFFEGTDLEPTDFAGISFTALLLAGYGHRACELGNFALGSYDPGSGKTTLPEVNFVRFAIPRLRYEKQDLDSVVEAVQSLYENRDRIPAVDVTHGRELSLRHFKARFMFRTGKGNPE